MHKCEALLASSIQNQPTSTTPVCNLLYIQELVLNRPLRIRTLELYRGASMHRNEALLFNLTVKEPTVSQHLPVCVLSEC